MSAEAHKSLDAAAERLGAGDRAVAETARELRKLDAQLSQHAKEFRNAQKHLYRDKMMGG